MAGLADIRAQHPEYGDMSDTALADALYSKFYSDMPRADFDAKMGVTSATSGADAPKPKTTLAGSTGAVVRGVGPYATGAAIGAGIGSFAGGAGAVPGALAGAGAVGLTDLSAYLWNATGERLGGGHFTGPTEAFGKAATNLGIPEARTPTERVIESTAQGATGALSGAGFAGQLAKGATKPVTKAVLTKMGEKPGLATVSGATSGAAQQTSAEMGAPPLVQTAAGMAGSLVPFAPAGFKRLPYAQPKPAAAEARQAGFFIPPAAAAAKQESKTSAVLAGLSGEAKTTQLAALKNSQRVNELAHEALGLPKDTVLSEKSFKDLRAKAGTAYGDVSRAMPVTSTDLTYEAAVQNLGNRMSEAAKEFPDLIKNSEVEKLVGGLSNKGQFSTDAAFQIVRKLRSDATANFKAVNDPEKLAVASSQWEAAKLIDDLVERKLADTGNPTLMQKYRDARVLIAKSHAVEAATNIGTGDVDPRILGGMADKGLPLTGELLTIAKAAQSFPQVFRDPAVVAGYKPLTVGDLIISGGTAAHALSTGNWGELAIPAAILSRPVARSGILSNAYQNRMIGVGPSGDIPASVLLGPITSATTANSRTR